VSERPVVAVLGLGATGESLALALRQTGRYAAVVGWDAEFDAARQAQRRQVADRFARRAQDAAAGAALVFAAPRSSQFQETLTLIAPHLRPGAIVCSLLDTHEAALRVAEAALPANVSFIAAHAIRGQEADDDTPSAQAFQGGVLCLSPSLRAHADAVAYVTQAAEALGMRAFFVDPREHDAFATGVGRLPAVLAAALMRVVSGETAWRELGRLAGPEFRQATALVEGDPALQQEALTAEREHAVRWLGAMIDELARLRDGLQDGQEPADFFASAGESRAKWLRDRQVPPEVAEIPATPTPARRRLWF
jgi:prephenate dehydrogenase